MTQQDEKKKYLRLVSSFSLITLFLIFPLYCNAEVLFENDDYDALCFNGYYVPLTFENDIVIDSFEFYCANSYCGSKTHHSCIVETPQWLYSTSQADCAYTPPSFDFTPGYGSGWKVYDFGDLEVPAGDYYLRWHSNTWARYGYSQVDVFDGDAVGLNSSCGDFYGSKTNRDPMLRINGYYVGGDEEAGGQTIPINLIDSDNQENEFIILNVLLMTSIFAIIAMQTDE